MFNPAETIRSKEKGPNLKDLSEADMEGGIKKEINKSGIISVEDIQITTMKMLYIVLIKMD